jgi:RNA polymerase sigma factor (sigma-70 family)
MLRHDRNWSIQSTVQSSFQFPTDWLDHVQRVLRRIARLRGISQADCDDLVQDTVLKLSIYLQAHPIPESREQFVSMAVTTFKRTHIDRFRKREREAKSALLATELDSASEKFDSLLEKTELFERLRKAILKLSPAERQLIQLHMEQGKTLREIEQMDGLPSRSTLSRLLASAMLKLSVALKDHDSK